MTRAHRGDNNNHTEQVKRSAYFAPKLKKVKKFSLKDERKPPKITLELDEQVIPKLLSRADHINDKGLHVLQRIRHLGRKHYRELVNIGADQSVMDTKFARRVLDNCNSDFEKYELSPTPSIELIVGNGGLVCVNSAIKLKINIRPSFAFWC